MKGGNIVDVKRAKEIAASPVMANVMCNGERIYIENVNEKTRTAYIHPLNNPRRRQEVELATLEEFDTNR